METSAQDPVKIERPWVELVQLMVAGERVDIRDATITEVTPLEAGIVRGQFRLTNCAVRGKFDVRRVTFAESLLFTDVVFEDGMTLVGCTVAGDFTAIRTTCKVEASFERLAVTGRTSLEACTFEVSADFTLATFGGSASLRCIFKEGATFVMVTVESMLILDIESVRDIGMWHATFNGLVHVTKDSKITGLLDLRSISAKGSVIIEMNHFGPKARLDLRGARLGSLTIKRGKILQAADNCLNLREMTVAGNVYISGVSCQEVARQNPGKYHDVALLTLNASRIMGSLDLEDSSFERSNGRSVGLSGIRLDGSLRLSHVACTGTLSIADTTITGNTDMDECTTKGRANFNRAEFGNRFGCNSQFYGPVSFENTKFRGPVRFLRKTEFRQGASFFCAHFAQEANFGGARLWDLLDLRYSLFSHALLLEEKREERNDLANELTFVDEPKKVNLDLRGCTYESLILPGDFRGLVDFASRIASDDFPSLVFLERSLRRAGRTKLADSIRRERYARERKLLGYKVWKPEWWWNEFYGWSSDYGTVVLRMFFVVVIFGLASGMAIHFVPYYLPVKSYPWAPDVIKLVSGGIAGVASALGIDALRRRFSSE